MLVPKDTLRYDEELGRHGPFALRGTGLLPVPAAPRERPTRTYGVAAVSARSRFYVTAWTTSSRKGVDERLRGCAVADARRRIDRGLFAGGAAYFVQLEG